MRDPSGSLPGDYSIHTPLFMLRVSPGERRGCIRCGRGVREGMLLCSRCRRMHPDDTVLSLDSLYFLSILSLIVALFIVNPGLFPGDVLDPGAAGMSAATLLILLPAVAMLPAYITSPRLFITRPHLETLSFVAGSALLTGGAVSLIFTGSALYITVILPGILLLYPSLSLFKRLRPDIASILLLGPLLLFLSFTRSAVLEEWETGPWFLTSRALAAAGLILIFVSFSLFFRRLELPAKVALPHTLLTAGIVTLGVTLYRLRGFQGSLTPGRLFPAEMGLFLLFTGAVMYTQKRLTEHTVQKNLNSIEEIAGKAERMEKEGHHFYALQHADRALEENMIHSFGSSAGEGYLDRVESPAPPRSPEVSLKEYELAHSEKASLLVAQYNIPGAIAEYMEAIRQNPDYLKPYLELASLLCTVPGRERDAQRFLNYFMASKLLRLSRWMSPELPLRYVRWAECSYALYERTLRLRLEILKSIGNPQEVWRFYTLRSPFDNIGPDAERNR